MCTTRQLSVDKVFSVPLWVIALCCHYQHLVSIDHSIFNFIVVIFSSCPTIQAALLSLLLVCSREGYALGCPNFDWIYHRPTSITRRLGPIERSVGFVHNSRKILIIPPTTTNGIEQVVMVVGKNRWFAEDTKGTLSLSFYWKHVVANKWGDL